MKSTTLLFHPFILLFSVAHLQFALNDGKLVSSSLSFMDIKIASELKCMELCIMYKICYSIRYDRKTKICYLNVEGDEGTDDTIVIHGGQTSLFAKKRDFPERGNDFGPWRLSKVQFGCAKHTCDEQSACIRDGICVPVFQGKKCKPSDFVLYSSPINNSFPVGSTIKLACYDSNVIGGFSLVTYRDDETWSYESEEFNCKLVTSVSLTCPSGYVRYGASCYTINKTLATWKEAKKYCKDQNAKLAKVDTIVENSFFMSVVSKFNSQNEYFWIGRSDSVGENDCQWIEPDKRVHFTDLWPDYFSDLFGRENCTEPYSYDGKCHWNDSFCTNRFSFICEKEQA